MLQEGHSEFTLEPHHGFVLDIIFYTEIRFTAGIVMA